MFKKRVLWEIFGTEWKEVIGGFRKLQNERCPAGFLKTIKLRWARLTA